MTTPLFDATGGINKIRQFPTRGNHIKTPNAIGDSPVVVTPCGELILPLCSFKPQARTATTFASNMRGLARGLKLALVGLAGATGTTYTDCAAAPAKPNCQTFLIGKSLEGGDAA